MRSFIHDESGPTSVEYATLLALIALVALAAVVAFGTRFNEMVTSLNDAMVDVFAASGID